MLCYRSRRETVTIRRAFRDVRFPCLHRGPLRELRLDLLSTVGETLYTSQPSRLRIRGIEYGLDRTQDDMKGDLTFLPVFDKRPIERRQQKVLAASADERFFYFSEIVVVIA